MPRNPLMNIMNYVESVLLATLVTDDSQILSKHATVIKNVIWSFPPHGQIKLNSDGASRDNSGDAGCGGLLRKDNGQWITGFTFHIGYFSAQTGELRGIYIGMLRAWQAGFKKLIVESDSLSSIQVVQKNSNSNIPLVSKIKSLTMIQWEVEFKHTLRECNYCADWQQIGV